MISNESSLSKVHRARRILRMTEDVNGELEVVDMVIVVMLEEMEGFKVVTAAATVVVVVGNAMVVVDAVLPPITNTMILFGAIAAAPHVRVRCVVAGTPSVRFNEWTEGTFQLFGFNVVALGRVAKTLNGISVDRKEVEMKMLTSAVMF
ncbi:hypothetical protein BC829DRAFT_423017 [Chytridium lagenaria]|nr:hypothetical protein BC829DRAFT_423017 [Chytridium lagenaria]